MGLNYLDLEELYGYKISKRDKNIIMSFYLIILSLIIILIINIFLRFLD